MKQTYPSKLLFLFALLTGLNLSALAQVTTYNYTGGTQSYTVPLSVTSIGIDMKGGCGGGGYVSSGSPGPVVLAGRVQATLNVTPGTVYYVNVGQAGQTDGSGAYTPYGGWNGGQPGQAFSAGGGAASDIRTTNSNGAYGSSASAVVLVAGGGGGGGDWGATGGAGGGTTGANGANSSTGGGAGGGGGTQAGAGSGGSGSGGQGIGGTSGGSAGGGASGWWGGNGGGSSGGGGGGGSSYPASPNSVVAAIQHTQGYAGANGNGQVVITVLCNGPGTITGNVPVCSGTTLALADPTSITGGTWSSSNTLVATVNPTSGVVGGIIPGNAVITYTITNSCGPLATATVTVNQSPTAIFGSSSVCVGAVTTLSNGVSGGTWTSGSIINATIDPALGALSGVSTGGPASTTVGITYTLPGGCFATTTETVKSTPNIFTISPVSAAFCAGGTGVDISLLGSTIGISYQLLNGTGGTVGGPQSGTGTAIDFGFHTTAGAYTVVATNPTSFCTSTMSGTATVIVNPLPSPITGSPNVCIGSTTTLSDPTPGGTWSSSNTAVASVGVASGVVTGYVAGTPTMTYTLSSGGCKVYFPMAVNTSPPAIGGTLATCAGGTTNLTDGSTGGAWSTSNAAIATVGVTTGVVTGIAAGSATITYASALGCITSSSLVVNPLPTPYTLTVSGGGSYCVGGAGVHVGLSYSSSGVDYQLYNAGVMVGGYDPVEGSNSGLDFGLETLTGSYTVIGTNILSGCSGNMTGAVTVTVKPLPDQTSNITGGGNFCAGTTGVPIGTDGSVIGIKYQLFNGSAPVGAVLTGTGLPLTFGLYTTPGTYTVLATNASTGCDNILGSTAVISIAPPPNVYTVGGGGSYCAGGGGAFITLSNSDGTAIYQVYKGTIAEGSSASGVGTPITFGPFTAAGVYTVQATDMTYGCTSSMSGSVTIVINPLPVATNVTGTGSYCAGGSGVHVGLDFGGLGIEYELLNSTGAVVDTALGTGGGLDFGLQTAGTYTVIGMSLATGCNNIMNGSAVVSVALPPSVYNVTGGGSFCLGGSGASVLISGSDAGVKYQLYKGTSAVGLPAAGTGSGGINFGLFTSPGSYTVRATNTTTTCTSNMADTAVISVNPLPVAYSVTGGGSFCLGGTGVDVQLTNSDLGVSYDLYISGVLNTTIIGTGAAIDFGLETATGAYTVVATNLASSCMKNMPGAANVVINALPAVHNIISGSGTQCAGGPGFDISLDASSTGISYQVISGSGPSGSPVAGSGGALSLGAGLIAGTYIVVATNPLTTCTDTMSGSALINIIPLPNDYPIGGGGNFCAGGTGVDVDLPSGGSDPGISYQAYVGGTPIGSPVIGSGGAVNFGNQTTGGIYTVIATNTSGCTKNMTGSAVVNPVSPTIYSVTGGGNFCLGGSGVDVNLNGSSAGETYQLYISGTTPMGAAVTGTGAPINFGPQTGSGIYTVVATIPALSCSAPMTGSSTIGINALPATQTVTGGGGYCIGGTGVPVGLSSSEISVNYQLYLAGVATGPALAGTTGGLNFGLKTAAGVYSVVATNSVTTCVANMPDSVTVVIQPAPNAYPVTVSDSGFYCAVGTGVHIGLANSDVGVNYQLYRSGITPMAVFGVMSGTGAALDFGLEAVAGSYFVTGSAGSSSSCNGNMAGTISVNIVPLPIVHNVTGGGGYCPGTEGVHIGLDASDPGITYTLYHGAGILDSMMYGTGYSLDYGIESTPGAYYVIGNSTITSCPNNMYGTPVVSVDTLLTPTATLKAYPGNDISVWRVDSIRVFTTNGGSNPTFQWVVNGNIIPGATNATFINYIFFNNDTVDCIITASGPCGELSTVEGIRIILNNANVGVNQVTQAGGNVVLVPNPNKGAFTIKGTLGSTLNEEVTLEVTNMLGQVVYTGKITAQNGAIDAPVQLGSELTNGMYMLNLRSGSETKVFHFVIAR